MSNAVYSAKIKQYFVSRKNAKGIAFTSSGIQKFDVNNAAYLTELEQLFENWKDSNLKVKIAKLLGLAQLAVDYYSDVADEPTVDEQANVISEVALIGWEFVQKKFNIAVPIYIRPLIGPAVQWLVKAGLEAAVSFLLKKKEAAKEEAVKVDDKK